MLAVFVAMAMALVALLLPVGRAHAVDDAGEVGAANVVYYDVSTAKRGADYRITASGDYHLKGSTNRVSIVVQPPEYGTVNIYLENGLRIDADFTGRGWDLSSAPAISIGEATGATVNIITLESAQVYLGGYRGAPAIRKNGTATKLIFSTRTAGQPGTLTAVASSEGSTPAIGSNGGSGTVAGNIHFESGKVEARGHDAPAIGCKDGNLTLKNLTISGGEVIATGSGANSAGIGGGKGGHAENITIIGGTVRATGSGGGAGIGSGSRGRASNITVSGGTVTAKGGTSANGGAGIGSGAGGSASAITVGGGTVDAAGGGYAAGVGGGSASSVSKIAIGTYQRDNLTLTARGGTDAPGIGCGAGENVSVSGIIVRGGTVTAIGSSTGGAGIGASHQCSSCYSIHIVGGTITATGGPGSAGIGAGQYCEDLSIITIEGGLIRATGGQSSTGDIGSNRARNVSVSGGTVDGTIAVRDNSPAVITGGSVRAFADDCKLVNGNNETVYRTVATVVGLTTSTKITDLNIGIGQGSSAARYDYGSTDLYTLADGDAQNLFVYLPGSTYTRTAEDANGVAYRGNVYPGEAGQLKPTTNVLLVSGNGYDGAAFATVGETSIEIDEEPTDGLGRAVDHYADSVGRRVADSNGMIYSGDTEYSSGGVWTYKGGNEATLETVWEAKTYTIVYEGNRPEDASTELVGDTQHAYVEADAKDAHINSGGFSLPGYRFTEWNTDPDGFGDDYEGGALIRNDLFLDADDGTVTLYAQWEPYTYEVKFESGDGTGEMKSQVMTFDQKEALDRNAFKPPSGSSSSFLYWKDGDENLYVDGEAVTNLCTFDQQSSGDKPIGRTLTAQWLPNNAVVITIFNNGEPVVLDNPGEDIVLVSTEDSSETVKGFSATDVLGVYGLSNVKLGTYHVDINDGESAGFPTDKKTITVENGKSNSFSASYCTITVKSADSAHVNAWIGESPTSPTSTARTVFQGEKVSLQAKTYPDSDALYVFDRYDVDGVVPDDLVLNEPDTQEIKVNGGVTITAHARPASYSVSFESNYPADASTKGQASGKMATMTDLLSTEEYKLPACAFTLPGYTFAGWMVQGGTAEYDDEATVRNLAKSDNETVTLEAQWKPNSYTVAFDANGGEGTMNPQSFTFDKSQNLTSNTFTRDGYTFVGWSTEAHPLSDDPSGTTYDDEASVSNLTSVDGATVTLYAQWERDTYTVTFQANATDAVGSMNPESVPTNEDWLVSGCGFTRAGYTFTGWNTEADGNGVTYEAGTTVPALAVKDGEVALYAQWQPVSYTLTFDANVPENASTTDLLTGAMSEQKLTYGKSAALAASTFQLPGYKFTGWNTEADGAGTPYSDQEQVIDLATEDGATVTLYAQWKPMIYTVQFVSNGGSGSMDSQQMTFDQSASLRANSFTNDGQVFIGWAISGETGNSTLIGDRETVVNLCTIDDDGKPQGHILSAVWAWSDDVLITLTKDNIAVENANIALVADGQTIPLTAYDGVPGVYSAYEIKPGTYRVIADGYPAGNKTVEVKDGQTATVALDYSTITVAGVDEHVDVRFGDTLGGSSRVVFTGDKVTISASLSDGYVFEGYAVEGIMPDGLDADNPGAQDITVQGKVALTGHARPAQYEVKFDANGGEGIMFPQDFTYDVAQTLEPNAFTRNGYVFSGWNTEADGSGAFYADQAQVGNLTTEDGAIVTLYAQWSTVGPNPPRPPATTYAVTVNTHAHGSAAADRKTASAGTTVTVTIDPDEGFELRDISALDGRGRLVELAARDDGTYTFTMPASSVTVQVLLGCDGGDLCPSRRFPDADPTQWYHDPLDWAIVHGILGGYSDTGLMGPEDAVTRAQMAQIIWNAEGRPSATDAKGFSDVSEDDWFADSVLWAQSAGVFVGYEGTDLFGPNDPLTREQATAVMMRWEQLSGNDVSARIDLSPFPDAGGVSAWALESMSWGVAADIISGVDQPDGSVLLDAQGACTRAQMATLMMRLRAVDQLDPFA
ncbi:InlB B-repeat-containing protein [Collinsella tanakaei]|uniref:InlB B-repeat-containing protein n=1 Tax=Collinsella tanakaei TaxID=626935 RepID=UPI00195AA0F3|nr:InlB B-repeat-containing protein [Collinsella tanakaei]MBM6779651.1 InlB B-repeat-containing protein [Collinsella tanakaei]